MYSSTRISFPSGVFLISSEYLPFILSVGMTKEPLNEPYSSVVKGVEAILWELASKKTIVSL